MYGKTKLTPTAQTSVFSSVTKYRFSHNFHEDLKKIKRKQDKSGKSWNRVPTDHTWVLQTDAVVPFCADNGEALCHTHAAAGLVGGHLLNTGKLTLETLSKADLISWVARGAESSRAKAGYTTSKDAATEYHPPCCEQPIQPQVCQLRCPPRHCNAQAGQGIDDDDISFM